MTNLEARAAKIKLLVLDVDGVLTDGGLYYDENGLLLKRFNVQDGLGIKMAQNAGLEIAVITGLNQPCVERRVRELGITHYHPGFHKKIPPFLEICEELGITTEEAAYMGDDWIDVGPMRTAGLAMSVPNAMPEILELADWSSERDGGHGAVREAIQFILKCRGDLEAQWQRWAE